MSPVGAVVAAGAFSSSGVPLAAIFVAIFAKVPAVNGRMKLCVYSPNPLISVVCQIAGQ
jgi:UDP-N-acetylmuramyl tripeptide synthase